MLAVLLFVVVCFADPPPMNPVLPSAFSVTTSAVDSGVGNWTIVEKRWISQKAGTVRRQLDSDECNQTTDCRTEYDQYLGVFPSAQSSVCFRMFESPECFCSPSYFRGVPTMMEWTGLGYLYDWNQLLPKLLYNRTEGETFVYTYFAGASGSLISSFAQLILNSTNGLPIEFQHASHDVFGSSNATITVIASSLLVSPSDFVFPACRPGRRVRIK